MGTRNSYEEQSAVTWMTAAVKLGTTGLDLRNPASPGLRKLRNARFPDQTSMERRAGHIGAAVRDGSAYPDFGGDDVTTVEWVYGHGMTLDGGAESAHYPLAGRGGGVFDYRGASVVWTGDRLLTIGDAQGFGESPFWGDETERGIPAHLPLITDTHPPDAVVNEYVVTLMTDEHQLVASSDADGGLVILVIDRGNGAVVSRTEFANGIDAGARLVQSGAYAMLLWIDEAGDLLYSYWIGSAWSAPATVMAGCDAFDVAQTEDGVLVFWRVASVLHIGRFTGVVAEDTPVLFASAVTVTGTPDGPVAVSTAPNGDIALLWVADDDVCARTYDEDLVLNGSQATVGTATDVQTLTAAHRLLSHDESTPHYNVVAHYSDSTYLSRVVELTHDLVEYAVDTRYSAQITSNAFRVGNEVFCWYWAATSHTRFLVAGSASSTVVGIADREEGTEAPLVNGVRALTQVSLDPLDEHTFVWARSYETGQDYDRPGNARVGSINFLPQLSTAHYGDSVYLSGSLVRNWDGVQLGEAGFHDYPTVASTSFDTGDLETDGTYQLRVYPVRYNRRGERFMGAAITERVEITGGDSAIVATIRTMPATSHRDVIYECYRTENLGTTFYYEGSVAMDPDAASVEFTFTMADEDLLQRAADSHETGITVLDELEEFGPLGCAILTVAGDRLWGAGGQVPAGRVQFSKLKEELEGAGFDAVAGTQLIDTQGGAIESIANFNDILAVFQRDRVYMLHGSGPDNYGNGAFSVPQMVMSDGATTHFGTALTQVGVVYWGADGPRLLALNLRPVNISDPVVPLTSTLTPTGVRVDLVRQEVVWYTAEGTAVLWNYDGEGRWAEWTGLPAASVSPLAHVTPTGRLLTESADAYGDDGVPFAFAGATNDITPEQVLAGATALGRVGLNGEYFGDHRMRLRVYYNGSPLWSEQQVWHPSTKTWLTSGETWGELTPAQIDALAATDHSGAYATHKKVARHNCRHFRVEWSDVSAVRPTYRPLELSLELGVRGGMGRVPVNTFTRS